MEILVNPQDDTTDSGGRPNGCVRVSNIGCKAELQLRCDRSGSRTDPNARRKTIQHRRDGR